MPQPRRFDHDEARRLRGDGWTYTELARRFGVSSVAVQRVCDPDLRARMNASAAANLRRKREPCKGGCGRLVWRHGTKNQARSGYCPTCHGALRAKTVRPDTLLCTHCGEWKPDEEFPRKRTRAVGRRNRHSFCRACQTETRREYREARKVPCIGCGTLVLHERRDPGRPPECHPCAMERMHGERRTRSTVAA